MYNRMCRRKKENSCFPIFPPFNISTELISWAIKRTFFVFFFSFHDNERREWEETVLLRNEGLLLFEFSVFSRQNCRVFWQSSFHLDIFPGSSMTGWFLLSFRLAVLQLRVAGTRCLSKQLCILFIDCIFTSFLAFWASHVFLLSPTRKSGAHLNFAREFIQK